MKAYAEQFYSSKAWQDCRRSYKKSKRYLCERCLADGRIETGEIVHHKIHLTPDNINIPEIALCYDNLELLCRQCHGEEHGRRPLRYKVDVMGRVECIR